MSKVVSCNTKSNWNRNKLWKTKIWENLGVSDVKSQTCFAKVFENFNLLFFHLTKYRYEMRIDFATEL